MGLGLGKRRVFSRRVVLFWYRSKEGVGSYFWKEVWFWYDTGVSYDEVLIYFSVVRGVWEGGWG